MSDVAEDWVVGRGRRLRPEADGIDLSVRNFRFETYRVAPDNEAAFDACRAIGALTYADASPVLLSGPPGIGKSHLLWATVAALRERAERAGLALILPSQFPEKVRALATNPEPIANGLPAVLLVDDFHDFRNDATDLLGVINAFLDHDHPVLLAGRPGCVSADWMPAALRAVLENGNVIDMGQSPALTEPPPSESTQEIDALRGEVETLRQERAYLEESLTAKNMEIAALRREKDAVPPEAQRALDALKQKVAEQDKELAAARTDAEAARAEQLRLQALIDTKTVVEETLAAAEADRDVLRASVTRYEERLAKLAASLTGRAAAIERRTAALLETQEAVLESAVRDAQRTAAANAETLEAERDDALQSARAYEAQLEQERTQFHENLEQLQSENEETGVALAEARAEQGRLAVALDSARGRLQAVEFELDKARRQLRLLTAEMDALRQEAASQSAKANLEAGALQHQIAQLRESLGVARDRGHVARETAGALAAQFSDAAARLQSLHDKLAPLDFVEAQSASGCESSDDQQSLFRTPPAKAAASESNPSETRVRKIPADPNLESLVSRAIADPSSQSGA